MGHAKVAEAPGQGGENREEAEFAGSVREDVGVGGEAQITGDGLCIFHHGIPAADSADAEDQDHDQRKGHDQALDQTCNGGGHKTAHRAVGNNDDGRDDHRGNIVPAEHGVEELAAGHKAGRGIGNEEDDDHQGADNLDELGVVPKTLREKVRNGDGIKSCRVDAESAGNKKPVEVSADGKADGGPARFGDAAEECQTGNTHQQIGAHVRGFGAHGRNKRAKLTSAEVKVGTGVGAFGVPIPDQNHADQVDDNGENDENAG